MKRSAAPSLKVGLSQKRGKFSTPYRNVSALSTSKDTAAPRPGGSGAGHAHVPTSCTEIYKNGDTQQAASFHVVEKLMVDKENKCLVSRTDADCNAEWRVQKIIIQGNKWESDENNLPESDKTVSKYFSVVWCKASKKKHKKWDGDGILIVSGRQVLLKDIDGKEYDHINYVFNDSCDVIMFMSKSTSYKSSELAALKDGETLFVGGKEIERKQFSDTPRHDPNATGAIVMPRPSASHQWLHNKEGLPVVDVVIDPFIASHLRAHQVEGVTFLYRCIMGMGNFQGNGAILADEMGLGKTLQCITLIWTLLKQGPFGRKPRFKRILIVTPGSLVKNWQAEFQKWLGNERIKTFTVNSKKTVKDFSKSLVCPVMIISYEMLLRNLVEVKNINFDLIVCDEGHRLKNFSIKTSTGISGLGIPCMILLTGTPIQNDLKEFYALGDLCNPGIFGTAASFRRNFEAPIIRSQEPGCSADDKLLGTERAAELKRLTDLFVLRRTSELNHAYLPPKAEFVVFCPLSMLQKILYNEILNSRAVSMCISATNRGTNHLVCISVLKKLCNHPSLLLPAIKEMENLLLNDVDNFESMVYDGLLKLYPQDFQRICPLKSSGKLLVLGNMLDAFNESKEKSVIVSNSTKTLDIFESVLTAKSIRFSRLDGKTQTTDRQRLVDNFNSQSSGIDVFLLSSKAGGTGLNLIGASRLILYDIDWNPANDLQAMARVWRDGQKRKVFVYRLLTTGTIEEKIYQRQISKQSLSGHIVDFKANKVEFSTEDLKDLFKLDDPVLCSTHDLIGCRCHVTGIQTAAPPVTNNRLCQLGKQQNNIENEKLLSMAELMYWNHILPTAPEAGLYELEAVEFTQTPAKSISKSIGSNVELKWTFTINNPSEFVRLECGYLNKSRKMTKLMEQVSTDHQPRLAAAGTRFANRASIKNGALVLTNLRVEDTGRYFCILKAFDAITYRTVTKRSNDSYLLVQASGERAGSASSSNKTAAIVLAVIVVILLILLIILGVWVYFYRKRVQGSTNRAPTSLESDSNGTNGQSKSGTRTSDGTKDSKKTALSSADIEIVRSPMDAVKKTEQENGTSHSIDKPKTYERIKSPSEEKISEDWPAPPQTNDGKRPSKVPLLPTTRSPPPNRFPPRIPPKPGYKHSNAEGDFESQNMFI
eukprot:gene14349-15845_t